MYPVKSTRMFFGTNTERTASGLTAFLPGDEFYETDTGDTYQHNGTGWTKKNTGGTPGGSNTQLQYNNSGAFGGTAGLVWDSASGTITHTKNTATTLEYFLVLDQDGAGGAYIRMLAGAANGRVGITSGSLEFASSVGANISGTTVGIAASTTITFDPGGYSSIVFKGSGTPEAVFNEQADTNFAFRIESGNNEYMVYIDPANDAFQIGGATAGTIADFRSTAIRFNDAEADVDISWGGNGVTDGYYYDAGNNRHGFGTGFPQRVFHIIGPSGAVASFPSSVGAADLLLFENAGNANMALIGTATATSLGLKMYKSGGTVHDGAILYNNNTDSMIVQTAQTTRMSIDSVGNITGTSTTGTFKINSLTTTQRNALTAADSMLIYNTTTGKFQGRASGAWVDLH